MISQGRGHTCYGISLSSDKHLNLSFISKWRTTPRLQHHPVPPYQANSRILLQVQCYNPVASYTIYIFYLWLSTVASWQECLVSWYENNNWADALLTCCSQENLLSTTTRYNRHKTNHQPYFAVNSSMLCWCIVTELESGT